MYQKDYQQLSDDRLSWPEFTALAGTCKSEAQNALGEAGIPWSPEVVIDSFVGVISLHRKEKSSNWVESVEAEAAAVETMTAADANRLHTRASSPPAILTEADAKRLGTIVKAIETRLEILKVDWLVERFKELPQAMRRRFLVMISENADG